MAHKIDVVLLEDIVDLGRAGDIVSVAEGHARNLLFPQGLAARATNTVIKNQAAQTKKLVLAQTERLATLQAQAELLHATELTLKAKVKEGEEIFGSITRATIAKNLNAQANLGIKSQDIHLKESLTTLGSQDIMISLGDGIETTIRVTVVPDAEPPT